MDRLMVDLQAKFEKYYSIRLSNYMVQDAYVPHPMVIKAGLPDLSARSGAEGVA
jgi:formylmethanofuran dehydrogenase subunit A